MGSPCHGGNSDYLNHVNNILSSIHSETKIMNKFCNEILNFDLLKLADIKVDFRNDDSQELKGLYVVDERRLKDLDKDSLFKLHKMDIYSTYI